MPEPHNFKFTESIVRQIASSRQQITILFTDIEYSTLHWDILGDVDGRLMVDQHNRLLFPVIKRFHGKIIKTIGDAIMASFKSPKDAVDAAIGIQQILSRARSQKGGFSFSVRIGIHTGTGIVEHKDVFGNVVNVAAKVESRCRGDEILLTGSAAMALSHDEYELYEQQGFVPKGKREIIPIFQCEWRKHWDLINDIRPSSFLSISTRDKADILIYTVISIGIAYFLYLKYVRYIIVDQEPLALLSLNPSLLLYKFPFLTAALTAIMVLVGFWIFHIRAVPHFFFRILKGMFGFAVGFLVIYLATAFLPMHIAEQWDGKLYQSKHLFVRVVEDDTRVHLNPSEDAPIIAMFNAGTLLLLTDLADQSMVTWSKVLIAPNTDAWIQRLTPAKLGAQEKQVTVTERFYFRVRDVVALLCGLVGFIWGIVKFRIRPM